MDYYYIVHGGQEIESAQKNPASKVDVNACKPILVVVTSLWFAPFLAG